jgi:hypothetical protein
MLMCPSLSVLLSLMERLGVSYPESGSSEETVMTLQNPPDAAGANESGSDVADFPTSQVDMDALFRSFATLPENTTAVDPSTLALWPSDGWQLQGGLFGDQGISTAGDQDVLYGLMSGGNLAGYDGLFKSHNL